MPDTSNTPPVVASGDYMIDVQFLSEHGKLLQGFKVYFHIINSKGGLVGLMWIWISDNVRIFYVENKLK